MSVLYICYQSLLDPLTQTQVVAYLEGLAMADEPIVLLTFEPTPVSEADVASWSERLAEKNIIWRRLTYHKRPTLPATLWDVMAGTFVGRQIIREFDVKLVHARSHVPALMGRLLKRITGVKLLFDFRGLLAEEYVDAGVWKRDGRLFRLTKRAERTLMASADAYVVLTERARELLSEWYPKEVADKPMAVIPCCADLTHVEQHGDVIRSPRDNDTPLNRDAPLSIVYAGKLDGWYLTDEMIDFFTHAAAADPHTRWDVWTQSDTEKLKQVVAERGLTDRVSIGATTPQLLKEELAQAHVGLAFIRPCVSKLASSPTKVAEYLAAGLPVISTKGIGDLDAVIRGDFSKDSRPVGVLVETHSPAAYAKALSELRALLDDPHTPDRCRAVARRLFDLKTVGWSRYRQLYAEIFGSSGITSEAVTSTAHEPDAESGESAQITADDPQLVSSLKESTRRSA